MMQKSSSLTHSSTHTHTYIHILTHTHTHIHTHTCTHIQLVPTRQREGWQSYIDDLCSSLSPPDKQVELVLMMMDTPANKMVVVCSAGELPLSPSIHGIYFC